MSALSDLPRSRKSDYFIRSPNGLHNILLNTDFIDTSSTKAFKEEDF